MAVDWDELSDRCVDFARRLIQTPSMPGEEGALADLVMAEMRELSFDEVWSDEMGNVFGRIKGEADDLGALVLNSHLDHVDPGDASLWPTPPYEAAIIDGRIIGRGACDIKGPLAVQVYAMAASIQSGERPRRDIVFSGVVQEEVGGAGARSWVDNVDYPVALIVLAEPSDNEISLGHRGIYQIWITFRGRSVHASVPEAGVNPNYSLARFLERLQSMCQELSKHPLLGQTTVAPTLIEVDTRSMNVTPAWTRTLLDFRTASESPNSLAEFVARVAGDSSFELSGAWESQKLEDDDEIIYGFYTPPDDPAVRRVQELIAGGVGYKPELTRYRFATDGRFFAELGAPIIGYSPGEESLAHTAGESIAIDKMTESLRGHVALLRGF
ncbi:MAG: M20/M25/M40 family metallo-hydrolase [Candidatus Promineifilaceae bacterium]|nr:M20/M25/M40 family metallo-hydrolase [Candidatus Promineifilaceae bacterium]